MTLTLQDFAQIPFDSTRQVTAREYKTLKVHRAVLEVRGNGSCFSDVDFAALRKEIARGIRVSILRGFGFGVHLRDFQVDLDLLHKWVDDRARRGGACQWVIVSQDRQTVADGVHMWMEGITTPIYESILEGFSERGFGTSNEVKNPTGFMKFALTVGSIVHPFLDPGMYKPGSRQ